MIFSAIRGNKILAKISKFTVPYKNAHGRQQIKRVCVLIRICVLCVIGDSSTLIMGYAYRNVV